MRYSIGDRVILNFKFWERETGREAFEAQGRESVVAFSYLRAWNQTEIAS